MTIHINQAMVDRIAGNDRWEVADITFSLNVDPGNFIEAVAHLSRFQL